MKNIGKFQKFKVPENPLQLESKENGMFPTKSWKHEKLRKYYQRIWNQIDEATVLEDKGRNQTFWNSYIRNTSDPDAIKASKQSLKTAVAFKILQLADGEIDQEIDEKFVEEFINWMLGKSKYNLDESTTPWGSRRLVGPDINAYLHAFVEKKMEFIKHLTITRAFIPQNLNQAWNYFKYCVCKKEPNHAAYLPQFNYWTDPGFRNPNNNSYNQLHDKTTGLKYSQRALMDGNGVVNGVVRDGAPGAGDPGSDAIVRENDDYIFDPAECDAVNQIPSLPQVLVPGELPATSTDTGQIAAGDGEPTDQTDTDNFEDDDYELPLQRPPRPGKVKPDKGKEEELEEGMGTGSSSTATLTELLAQDFPDFIALKPQDQEAIKNATQTAVEVAQETHEFNDIMGDVQRIAEEGYMISTNDAFGTRTGYYQDLADDLGTESQHLLDIINSQSRSLQNLKKLSESAKNDVQIAKTSLENITSQTDELLKTIKLNEEGEMFIGDWDAVSSLTKNSQQQRETNMSKLLEARESLKNFVKNSVEEINQLSDVTFKALKQVEMADAVNGHRLVLAATELHGLLSSYSAVFKEIMRLSPLYDKKFEPLDSPELQEKTSKTIKTIEQVLTSRLRATGLLQKHKKLVERGQSSLEKEDLLDVTLNYPSEMWNEYVKAQAKEMAATHGEEEADVYQRMLEEVSTVEIFPVHLLQNLSVEKLESIWEWEAVMGRMGLSISDFYKRIAITPGNLKAGLANVKMLKGLQMLGEVDIGDLVGYVDPSDVEESRKFLDYDAEKKARVATLEALKKLYQTFLTPNSRSTSETSMLVTQENQKIFEDVSNALIYNLGLSAASHSLGVQTELNPKHYEILKEAGISGKNYNTKITEAVHRRKAVYDTLAMMNGNAANELNYYRENYGYTGQFDARILPVPEMYSRRLYEKNPVPTEEGTKAAELKAQRAAEKKRREEEKELHKQTMGAMGLGEELKKRRETMVEEEEEEDPVTIYDEEMTIKIPGKLLKPRPFNPYEPDENTDPDKMLGWFKDTNAGWSHMATLKGFVRQYEHFAEKSERWRIAIANAKDQIGEIEHAEAAEKAERRKKKRKESPKSVSF